MSGSQQERLPLAVYDCFSDQRFGGNVGGIVFDAGGLEADQMQNIAREINAPVTGFVTGQNGDQVSVRFFMPGAEIPMCGHVTVGLFTHLVVNAIGGADSFNNFVMKAPAGKIQVQVQKTENSQPDVMMQLAIPKIESCEIDHAILADALRVDVGLFSTSTPIEIADAGLRHIFIQFDALSSVQELSPDFAKLAEFSRTHSAQTVACFTMKTAKSDNTLHIRDFCPAVGANEVPASGTTNAALSGYLLRHDLIQAQKTNSSVTVLAEQGAEIGRPSLIRTEVDFSNGEITALRVGGQALASIEGTVSF